MPTYQKIGLTLLENEVFEDTKKNISNYNCAPKLTLLNENKFHKNSHGHLQLTKYNNFLGEMLIFCQKSF